MVTLYERLRLAKNVISGKLKTDIKLMKEEYKMDTTKLEEDFDKLVQIRFK
jgi:hypothetical protein